MSSFDKEIITKQTAQEMERAFSIACEQIREGYAMLDRAQKLLEATFGKYTHYGDLDVIQDNDRTAKNKTRPERIIHKIKKSVWYKLIGLLNLDRLASKKRYEEIQKNLESGNLPDVTVANIFDTFMSFMQNQEEITKELVQEAFKTLFPERGKYITNRKHDKGTNHKVILTWKVEHRWSGEFRVRYHSEQDLIVVDRVFHILDGKSIPDGYRSPLVDAINTSGNKGTGETEYFKFRACQNANLHLEFKRMDLLNTLAGLSNNNRIRSQ